METALIEVEGVINCRPLTPVNDDGILEPLTPSHLFAGRNIGVKLGNSYRILHGALGEIGRC